MQSKRLIIPKGTRVTIQGCPFYLDNDTSVGEWSEESQRILDDVLAEENEWINREVTDECSSMVKR